MGKRRQYGDYRFIKDGMDRRAAYYFGVNVMEKQGIYTALVNAENNIAFLKQSSAYKTIFSIPKSNMVQTYQYSSVRLNLSAWLISHGIMFFLSQ